MPRCWPPQAAWLGLRHPLAVHFRKELDRLYGGKFPFLDEWLTDLAVQERFLGLLGTATEQLLRDGAFTEYGRVGGVRCGRG